MLRNSLTTLAIILAIGACKKDKTDGTTPVDTGKKIPAVVAKGKTVTPEIADALDKAKIGCTSVHDAADPEKAKDSYDAVAAQKTYEEECKTPLDAAITSDATLAVYKGDINGKVVDVVSIKKMASAIPGRIEIAKISYEEAAKLRKEAEAKIWEPLLKNEKLKVYQEKGRPVSSNATVDEPAAVAQATTWVYESAPRDNKGKKVIDRTTYKFKKDGKADGKPKTEVTDYIAPE
jgi:signal recognition particle subunit SEC65